MLGSALITYAAMAWWPVCLRRTLKSQCRTWSSKSCRHQSALAAWLPPISFLHDVQWLAKWAGEMNVWTRIGHGKSFRITPTIKRQWTKMILVAIMFHLLFIIMMQCHRCSLLYCYTDRAGADNCISLSCFSWLFSISTPSTVFVSNILHFIFAQLAFLGYRCKLIIAIRVGTNACRTLLRHGVE